VIWRRIRRQVLRFFVPKGLYEGSQVRSAWHRSVFQAINCLAAIIESLRDKVRFFPPGQQTSLTTVHKSDAIPHNPFEDEDDDEDEDEMPELVTCREAITPP
jgi:hypothetical protein